MTIPVGPVGMIPSDETGSYPALVGAVPVSTGQRVGARLLGGLVYSVLYGLTFLALLLAGYSGSSGSGLLGGLPLMLILVPSVAVIAELVLMLTTGATIGHFMLGLRHVSVTTGKPAGPATLLKYFLENLIGMITLGLGYLLPILTIKPPLQRNWFDRTVGVMVVNRRRVAAPVLSNNQPYDAQYPPEPYDAQYAPESYDAQYAPENRADHSPEHGAVAAAPETTDSVPAAQWPPPLSYSDSNVEVPAPLDLPPSADVPAPADVPLSADMAPAADIAPAADMAPAADGAGQTIIADVLRPMWESGDHAAPPIVHLDNGVTFPLDGPCILGRDPSNRPGLEDARLVRVPDKEMSLSKTHLAIGPSPTGAWVMDLHSTNGVRMVLPTGEVTALPRGQRCDVPLGTTIEYGLRTLSVTAS